MSPLITALFIVLCVGMIGAVAAFVRDRARYSGYRDIMREVISFAKSVNGEVFRDGGDLVVSGEQKNVPLVVRFSHAENTPGLSIRIGAPATFKMGVFPRGQHGHGGALVKTADETFNTKFEVRSEEPTEAQLFLDSSKTLAGITRLCRSGHDFLTIGSGAIEFGQLGFPNSATARAIPTYIDSLNVLRDALRAMPGSERVKVEPRQRRRDFILRGTIIAGVIAVIATLYITSHAPAKQQASENQSQVPEGMTPADAAAVSNLNSWRTPAPNETDDLVVAWFRDRGVPPSARVVLNLNGGSRHTSAYLLTNDGGERRVVLLADGNKVYDARFPQIAAIARVPSDAMAQVKWSGSAPSPQGDGLLLIRDPHQPTSGIILYGSGNRILSAIPENWEQVTISSEPPASPAS
jgi:hypothetical protein